MINTAKMLLHTFLLLAGTGLVFGSDRCQAQPLEWTATQALTDDGGVHDENEMASWTASDGQGTVVTVYKDAGGLAGSRSVDGGQTWVPVFDSQLQDFVEVFDADVVYAGAGTFVATLIGWSSGDSDALSSKIYVMKSLDNGQTWSEPVAIPSDPVTTIPYQPIPTSIPDIDAASDGNGKIIAASRTRLYKSTDFGDTWTSSGLFAVPNSYFQPPHGSKIAYNGSEKWVHVYSYWQDYSVFGGGFDGYFQTWYAGISTDGGVSWTKVKLQSFSGPPVVVHSYDIAASGNSIGILGTFYNGSTDNSFGLIKSLDGGASFTSPTPVPLGNLTNWSAAVSGTRWIVMGQRPDTNIIDGYISHDNMETWETVNRPVTQMEEALPSTTADGSGFVVSYGQLQKAFPSQLVADWDIKADRFDATWSTGGFVNANAAMDGAFSYEHVILSKCVIKLNFKKHGKDSIQLKADLNIPAGFDPLGMTAAVNVGGVERIFVMDAKGNANIGSDKLRLKFKSKKGVVEEQLATLSVHLKMGNFAAALADEGLVNHDVEIPIDVNVTIYVGETAATDDLQLFYKAKAGKKGTAK